jgi:hypothetical protein
MPDAVTMREEFEAKRDRYGMSKPNRKTSIDDDDDLDDLLA